MSARIPRLAGTSIDNSGETPMATQIDKYVRAVTERLVGVELPKNLTVSFLGSLADRTGADVAEWFPLRSDI